MCLWANTAPRRLSLLSRTGQVEVWTHPVGRRWERTVIDLLKKGQSFGDQAILNGELRSECVTAASNVSMLTVGGGGSEGGEQQQGKGCHLLYQSYKQMTVQSIPL